MSDGLVAQLNDLNRCIRCDCGACVSGYENHEHICSGDKGCVAPLEPKLRKAIILAGRAATALTEARAEIERLRQEVLVKDSAIIEAAKLAKKLMTRAVQAEQEHTDMMWQRRRAEERAEEAESALAEAVEVMRPFADEAAKYDPDEGDSHEHAWGRLDLTIGHLRTARRFIASQEPAEQEK